MGLNEGVHSRLSSCICRVGVVSGWCRYRGWSGREGEYSCRGSGRLAGVSGGDGVETGACIYREFELWLQSAELT